MQTNRQCCNMCEIQIFFSKNSSLSISSFKKRLFYGFKIVVHLFCGIRILKYNSIRKRVVNQTSEFRLNVSHHIFKKSMKENLRELVKSNKLSMLNHSAETAKH